MGKEEILRELDISLSDYKKDIEYIYKLKKTKDKVRYLRTVKTYKQAEVAEMIGISVRHVQRIEKNIKNI